jgi:hypothetical protein
MDESSMINNRRSRRSPVLLAAAVEVAGAQVAVKLRNHTEEGALIEGETLPLEGARTVFGRNELSVPGRVVWVQGRYAGIAFDERLNPDEVLRHVPAPKPKTQQPGDLRRPGRAGRALWC